jgi:hypothetical protein
VKAADRVAAIITRGEFVRQPDSKRPLASAFHAKLTFRGAQLRSMVDDIFTAAVIGSSVAYRDENSIMELVLEDAENFRQARAELGRAAKKARTILDLINLAERRLGVALQSVDKRSLPPTD